MSPVRWWLRSRASPAARHPQPLIHTLVPLQLHLHARQVRAAPRERAALLHLHSVNPQPLLHTLVPRSYTSMHGKFVLHPVSGQRCCTYTVLTHNP